MHEVIQQSEGQEGSFVHLVRSSSINCVTKFLYLHPLSALCLLSELKWKKILLKIWSLKIMRKFYYPFSTCTIQRSELVSPLSIFFLIQMHWLQNQSCLWTGHNFKLMQDSWSKKLLFFMRRKITWREWEHWNVRQTWSLGLHPKGMATFPWPTNRQA